MIALYIIGAVLLLVFILLLHSIRLKIHFSNDGFKLDLYYSFLHFRIIPKKTKSKKKIKSNADKKTSPEKKIEKSISISGYYKTFLQFRDAIIRIIQSLGTLISHIRINPLQFDLIMAGKDAADLAIEYGKLCSVFYPFLSFLNEQISIKNQKINISVDYTKPKYEINLDLKLKIRVIYLISFAFKILFELIKVKLNQNINNSPKGIENNER